MPNTIEPSAGRTPCECVDWNCIRRLRQDQSCEVALLVSAWIEMLKRLEKPRQLESRTPCECVDWNCFSYGWRSLCSDVALLVSAWIEINAIISILHWCWQSHSLWVRGLKYLIAKSSLLSVGRTPCECVDWNRIDYNKVADYYTSHSLWVRGLK